MPALKETNPKLWFRGMGCLIAALAGVLLLTPLGRPLQELSFDLPFCFRSYQPVTNAVIVYANDKGLADVLTHLNPASFQPHLRTNWPPDRRIYGPLLDALKKSGARLVFFDFDFSNPRHGEDEKFAQAIQRNEPVVLGAVYDKAHYQSGTNAGLSINTLHAPNRTLLQNFNNWGILAVAQKIGDPHAVVRQIFLRDDQMNASVVIAAQLASVDVDTNATLWLNYYGPAYRMNWVALTDILNPSKAGEFSNRTVFIGGGDPVSGDEEQPDLHPTPYSRFGGLPSSGVELLATSYVNLVNRDYLKEMPLPVQGILVIGWAALAMAVFLLFRVRYIFLMAPVAALVPLAAGFCTQWFGHTWWSWTICSFVQTPLAAGWAVVANRWYPWPPLAFISYRRREGGGSGYAQGIWNALEHRGCGAVCDVKAELITEPFRPQLLALIDSVPNFILVISEGALNPERIHQPEDVLRAEIRHALETNKNIISIIIDQQNMPSDLPPDVKPITERHALMWHSGNPQEVLDQIIANLRRPSILARILRRKF